HARRGKRFEDVEEVLLGPGEPGHHQRRRHCRAVRSRFDRGERAVRQRQIDAPGTARQDRRERRGHVALRGLICRVVPDSYYCCCSACGVSTTGSAAADLRLRLARTRVRRGFATGPASSSDASAPASAVATASATGLRVRVRLRGSAATGSVTSGSAPPDWAASAAVAPAAAASASTFAAAGLRVRVRLRGSACSVTACSIGDSAETAGCTSPADSIGPAREPGASFTLPPPAVPAGLRERERFRGARSVTRAASVVATGSAARLAALVTRLIVAVSILTASVS